MPSLNVSQGLMALAGITAGSAYLDAKYHISKDFRAISRFSEGEKNYEQALKDKKGSGFFLFEEWAQKIPDELCVWSRTRSYTFRETYERSCQYGQYFQSLGVKPLDYVGLYLYNRPEFIFAWFGLMSLGAAPALINYNLASEALLHCVRISGSKFLFYDTAPDCTARIMASKSQLEGLGVQVFAVDEKLTRMISKHPAIRPSTTCFEQRLVVPFALLYTSGTTGMPKAYPVPGYRNYAGASIKQTKTFEQRSGVGGDRSFLTIPLYHGTAGFAGMTALMFGTSVALVPKFSLSTFWRDCIDSESTIFVYVGELVRYLLSAPPAPTDRQHKIRLAWGNGLSPELWAAFRERFGVAEIGEFFSSTEGFLTLFNYNKGSPFGQGAVGHQGLLLRRRNHNMIVPVQIDAETGEVWRDPKTGFAKRMPYEEGGEILVRFESAASWPGYFRNKEASNKKILQDVFAKGDVFWRTGDALRRNADGLWYFMDRLGDTYKFKGETVSTTEVSQAMSIFPDIAEANVYGVKVPAQDGRAGCAAISFKSLTAETFDWRGLAAHMRAELPEYALPLFIRVRGLMTMGTDNLKFSKVKLRNDGIDPSATKPDQMFWLPKGAASYQPFTSDDWTKLSQSRARI